MGTLLFIFLKATHIVEFPYDFLLMCFLVSLDSISLSILYFAKKTTQKKIPEDLKKPGTEKNS